MMARKMILVASLGFFGSVGEAATLDELNKIVAIQANEIRKLRAELEKRLDSHDEDLSNLWQNMEQTAERVMASEKLEPYVEGTKVVLPYGDPKYVLKFDPATNSWVKTCRKRSDCGGGGK